MISKRFSIDKIDLDSGHTVFYCYEPFSILLFIAWFCVSCCKMMANSHTICVFFPLNSKIAIYSVYSILIQFKKKYIKKFYLRQYMSSRLQLMVIVVRFLCFFLLQYLLFIYSNFYEGWYLTQGYIFPCAYSSHKRSHPI